jgi:hypothetical protein
VAEIYVPRRRSPSRAVLRTVKRLFAVAGALALIWLSFVAIITPACPEHVKMYTATPTDVHGYLEYCIAEAEFTQNGRKGAIWSSVVRPDAICSPVKAELVTRAAAMTKVSVDAQDACEARFIDHPHEWFIAKPLRWFRPAPAAATVQKS